MFDDYSTFPGETRALDDFMINNSSITLQKLPFYYKPTFIIKE